MLVDTCFYQEEEELERRHQQARKEREEMWRVEDLEDLHLEPRAVETREERFRNKNEAAKKLANWTAEYEPPEYGDFRRKKVAWFY